MGGGEIIFHCYYITLVKAQITDKKSVILPGIGKC